MADLDSYLLKCTLESIDKGMKSDDILKNCECQMGFINCGNDNHNEKTLTNGENNVRSR